MSWTNFNDWRAREKSKNNADKRFALVWNLERDKNVFMQLKKNKDFLTEFIRRFEYNFENG